MGPFVDQSSERTDKKNKNRRGDAEMKIKENIAGKNMRNVDITLKYFRFRGGNDVIKIK